jgi:hypothetical protein
MNCCGKKRKEMLETVKHSMVQVSANEVSSTFAIENPQNIFEYTGDYFLTIPGTATGKNYHFKRKGEKLNVDYADSYSMMAERDLVLVAS